MATNPNLQILGLQALPRLAKKCDIELDDFLTFSDLYGKTAEEFTKACDNCAKILHRLFEKHQISWWDVYLNSDIGMERIALARDMGLEKDDTVLEIGCGRGYFTIAAARFSKRVIGLDLMNGMDRRGWWNSLKETITELGLKPKVSGLRADAQIIPLKDCSVNKVVAAHSIRNFHNKQALQNAIREMNRVLSKDSEMIIIESLPVARNKAQEAHLALFRCKCKYGWGDLPYFPRGELLKMFDEAGLKEAHVDIVDYNLSAAPPIFCLNTSTLKKEQVEEAEKEYNEAIDRVKKYGETCPPAVIIKASKRSR
jgi:ubiquinone/menaquinone biosynthesis C-methylase UbiE